MLPPEPSPELRLWLSERIAWYDEMLEHLDTGAVVAPEEHKRLEEEATLHRQLLEILNRDDEAT